MSRAIRGRALDRCGLPLPLVAHLERHSFHSAYDIINKIEVELSEILDMDYAEAIELRAAIAKTAAPAPTTAWEVHERGTEKYALRLHESFQELSIQTGLTEIVGPAGVGKTQTCLTLCTLATLPTSSTDPSSAGSAIYIDTESTFSSSRLAQIASSRFPDLYPSAVSSQVQDLCSRVLIYHVKSSVELLNRLQSLETEILDHDVKLIIVDSIASVVRNEFHGGQLHQRQQYLSTISSILKYLSEQFQVACVATNQVTTRIVPASGIPSSTSTSTISAALGVNWAHAVNTRWIVEQVGQQRRIRIAKSPMFENTAFAYSISGVGVVVERQIEDGGGMRGGFGIGDEEEEEMEMRNGSVIDMNIRRDGFAPQSEVVDLDAELQQEIGNGRGMEVEA